MKYLIAFFMFTSTSYAYCGLPPLPPLPPLGTSHCEAVCVCDAYSNCHYEFICR